MKFLKQTTYIRYALVELSKFVQISTIEDLGLEGTEDSLKIKKGVELVYKPIFPEIIG